CAMQPSRRETPVGKGADQGDRRGLGGVVRLRQGYGATAFSPYGLPSRSSEGAKAGAGEGNRTLVCSLGSCRSTIELRPHSSTIANGECARQARFSRSTMP